MNFNEKEISDRNGVVKFANEIIKYLKANRGAVVVMAWGDRKSMEFAKRWRESKIKPKRTDEELRTDIFDWLRKRVR